jgi:hypothetical protein
VRQAWNFLQLKLERFPNEQFVEPPIFTKDEGIVEAGDEKDVLHPKGHQVFEALEELLGVKSRAIERSGTHIGRVARRCRVLCDRVGILVDS